MSVPDRAFERESVETKGGKACKESKEKLGNILRYQYGYYLKMEDCTI